jgi:hypothetical protein
MARQAHRMQRTGQNAPPQQTAKVIAFQQFEKMNTKPARQNLPETEAGFMENLQPIAPNDLKAVPGAAAALATLTSETVLRFFGANIKGVDYVIAFTVLGAGIAINANTGAKTTFAPDGTFNTTVGPDMTVFASARILIMDPFSGYSTWDGTLFVGSGGISPNIVVTNGGSGYGAPPAVSFTGGAGGNAGGATATAVLSGGSVVAVNLTNPGTGNAAGAAITVVFTGANTTPATATVVVWPQLKGSTIAIFAGRVWIGGTGLGAGNQGRLLSWTGTAGFDDTNPANAAGSTVITDADLAHSVTALRALNNFLYIFGDQSIKQIGSITVQSSITLFTPLTLASDIGTSFPMTILSYNRLVLFANKQGVYGIFGASVQKVSDDLDGIFQLTDFSLLPSAALNDLNNIHCYLLLLKYLDPVLGSRSIIVAFQQNKWFVVSQGSLIAITSLPLASTTQVETFGSSGSDVTQLLTNPNVAVPVTLRTALSSHGNLIQAKKAIKAGVAVTTSLAQNFSMLIETENNSVSYPLAAASIINWINNSGGLVTWQNNSLGTVVFIGGGFRFPYSSVDGYGKVLGATITGTVMLFAINAVAIEYIDADEWGILP